MSKIAIFYGPLGGAVNRVADKIKDAIGEEKVDMIAVEKNLSFFERYLIIWVLPGIAAGYGNA